MNLDININIGDLYKIAQKEFDNSVLSYKDSKGTMYFKLDKKNLYFVIEDNEVVTITPISYIKM